MKRDFGDLADKLDPDGTGKETPCCHSLQKKNEGFKTASKVQYVARHGNFIDRGVEYHGALQILKVILRYDYLWQNIRVKGGAYGCMSSFNRSERGICAPTGIRISKSTMDSYRGRRRLSENFTVSDRDMTKFIIGTISNMDQPMTPAAKGDRSMNLYMNHVIPRDDGTGAQQILHAAQEDIRHWPRIGEQY